MCDSAGGELLWQDEQYRVVLVDHADYPGFCRVIWNRHVREMTDLDRTQRQALMAAVFAVEQGLRDALSPHKINLASLGNVTPHLHWHVIPRYRDDRHFPRPIWGTATRAGSHPVAAPWREQVKAAVVAALSALR